MRSVKDAMKTSGREFTDYEVRQLYRRAVDYALDDELTNEKISTYFFDLMGKNQM